MHWFSDPGSRCGCDGHDTTLLVEGHAVDAHLAMDAWLAVHKVLVDAVIDDVPLVFAWNLKDGIMGCAVDFILWFLLDNEVVAFVDVDGAEG